MLEEIQTKLAIAQLDLYIQKLVPEIVLKPVERYILTVIVSSYGIENQLPDFKTVAKRMRKAEDEIFELVCGLSNLGIVTILKPRGYRLGEVFNPLLSDLDQLYAQTARSEELRKSRAN